MRPKTHCQKCKHPIPQGRRLCGMCRKNTIQSARIFRPDIRRVLAHDFPVASESFYSGGPRIVTTSDILNWAWGVSLISCNQSQFREASDKADSWNAVLNKYPTTNFQIGA